MTATSATFTFTASETGTGFQCSLDGSTFADCTSPQSYSGLAPGTHTFQVRALDFVRNEDPTPAAQTWTIAAPDTTPPETTIDAGPAGTVASASASFAFSASETGSSFQCQLDGAAWTACTSPQAYSALPDGSHTFAVRATDAAGNTDATPATRSWTIDTAAPDTTLSSGPSGTTTSTSASFAFSASETGAAFECRLDGAAWSACTSPQAYSGLAVASHTFDVRARDAAGNVDVTPASRTWTIASTPTSNDNFANAAVISGASGTTSGSTAGMTKEAGEPNHAGNAGGHSIWYRWTAPAGGTVTIDTIGSSFDTLLAVYTGTALTALTTIASNDDASGTQSRVTFTAVSGTTYSIAVDGYGGATGNVTLNWSLGSSASPANDMFASAAGLTGASGTRTGSNTGATKEPGEPNHAGNAGGHSVWFSWTAPAGGATTFKTAGSSFDTLLAVYTGSALSALTQAAANDDADGTLQSRVAFTATAGTTYRIAVDGYGGSSGTVTLAWSQP